MPVKVAEWSKAWTVLARLDAGIVGSNPTRGMNVYVYVYVYSMFVLSCVDRGLAMSWSLVQGVLPTVLNLRNWSETESFMDAPCSSGSYKGKIIKFSTREYKWAISRIYSIMATVLTETSRTNTASKLIMCQYDKKTHSHLNMRQNIAKTILESNNIH
jgi:hypothetical protein